MRVSQSNRPAFWNEFSSRGPLRLAAAGLLILVAAAAIADERPSNAAESRARTTFHIVGYLPEYRMANIDVEIGQNLTDLICFSAQADAAGDLRLGPLNAQVIQKLKAIQEKHPVDLFICVGGWARSKEFPKLAASPAARERFVAAVTDFCLENGFAGVDIDWEHPAGDAEYRDYATLLTAIKKGFERQHLQLTIAVAGWQALPAQAIEAVDRIHLMAYDAPGRHSTYEFAQADVERLEKSGVPPDKICLGVPFYGRSIQDPAKALPWSEIVRRFKPGKDIDEVDGFYFNGIATIERKTKFALERNLAGVMAWEIGQDVAGEQSLLRTMRRTIDDSLKKR
jgi:GH18 family chitinase